MCKIQVGTLLDGVRESARGDHEDIVELVHDPTHAQSDQTLLPEHTIAAREQLHTQLGPADVGVEHGVDLARQLLRGQHGDTADPGNEAGAERLDDWEDKGESFTGTCWSRDANITWSVSWMEVEQVGDDLSLDREEVEDVLLGELLHQSRIQARHVLDGQRRCVEINGHNVRM